MPTTTIDNFSGALNNRAPEKIGLTEAAELTNLLPIEGDLQMFAGKTKLNATAIGTSAPVCGHTIYRKIVNAVATSYTLVQCANKVWLDIDGAGDFRPLFTVSGTTKMTDFTQAGKYCYICTEKDTTSAATLLLNEPMRWDGSFHATGTATCAATTAVTGASSAWNTTPTGEDYANVLRGDTMWFYISSAWTGPYYVASVESDTALTLTAAGPTGTTVPYIISRTHLLSIIEPGGVLSASIDSGNATDEVGSAAWDYGFMSMALDSSKYPHFVYLGPARTSVKYSKWTGTAWETTTIVSSATTFETVNIYVDASNNPHVVYTTYPTTSTESLYYMKKSSGAWSVPTLIATDDSADWAEMAVDSDAHVHLVWKQGHGASRYIKYATNTTGSFVTTTLSTTLGGWVPSVTLNASGNPLVVWTEGGSLLYRAWSGSAWSAEVDIDGTTTVMNKKPSIAVDSSGYIHVSYAANGGAGLGCDLKYAKYISSWVLTTIDTAVYAQHTSIDTNSTPNPTITYYETTNYDLKYRTYSSSWSSATSVASTGDVGNYCTLVIDSTNYLHIGYYDKTNAVVKYWTNSTRGSALGTGDYQYKYTYRNSHSGYESNAVVDAVTVTTTSNGSRIAVTLPAEAQNPADLQIDEIVLYRTLVSGSVFRGLTTLHRTFTGYTFQTTAYIDAIGDEAISADQIPEFNDAFAYENSEGALVRYRPTATYLHGSRLYLHGDDNALRFSDMDDLEYFPANTLSVDLTTLDDTAGGFRDIGDRGNNVTAVISESSNSLLVFKRSGWVYRWSGLGWVDFSLDEAFEGDCLSAQSVASGCGRIFWISRRGPMMLQMGTNTPIPIYDKIFPTNSTPFDVAYTTGSANRVCCAVWRDYFIFSYPQTTAAANNRVYVYHIPSNTWTQLGDATTTLTASTFAIKGGPSDDGSLYMGDSSAGTVWKLFAKTSTNTYWTGTTGVVWAYKTGLIAGGAQRKKVDEVRIYLQRPISDQTLNCQMIPNVGTVPTAKSITIDADAPNATDARQLYHWIPPQESYGFQLRFSGVWTVPCTISTIEVDWHECGSEPKR